jgi:hypothetical protein
LPEAVTEPLSPVLVMVVDATGERSGDPPHAARVRAPPSATNARNREDVCISSS